MEGEREGRVTVVSGVVYHSLSHRLLSLLPQQRSQSCPREKERERR